MKRFRVRFINEDAAVQPATVASDVSLGNTQNQNSDNSQQQNDQIPINFVDNEEIQKNGLDEQDIDSMSDGAVLSTMLNPNAQVDDITTQALGDRASDFVTRLSTNTITPDEKKKVGEEMVTNFKTAQQTGFAESLLWNDLETKILKSLNENDEFDFSADIAQERQNRKNPPPSFDSFLFTLGLEVANQLCNKFRLDADRERKVLNWVTQWLANNTKIAKSLYINCNGRETEKEVQEVIKKLQREFISDFS